MDAESANYYTREVMLVLVREFQSPDEEMKKIVLKVVKQCCATDGVEPTYISQEILPPYFKYFWNHRMAMDKRNYRQVCLIKKILKILKIFKVRYCLKCRKKSHLPKSFGLQKFLNLLHMSVFTSHERCEYSYIGLGDFLFIFF